MPRVPTAPTHPNPFEVDIATRTTCKCTLSPTFITRRKLGDLRGFENVNSVMHRPTYAEEEEAKPIPQLTLPPDFQTPSSPSNPVIEFLAIIDNLLKIGPVAFKGHNIAKKEWVIENLTKIIDLLPHHTYPNRNPQYILPWSIYPQLITLTKLYKLPHLTRLILKQWMKKLLYQPDPTPALDALKLVDRWGLNELEEGSGVWAVAAYVLVIRQGQKWIEEYSQKEGGLTGKQRTHLLTGFYSLRTYTHNLFASPPPSISPCSGCTSHERCLSIYNEIWALASPIPLDVVDVLGRLEHVKHRLAMEFDEPRKWGKEECRGEAIRIIRGLQDRALRGLSGWFDLD